MREFKEPEGIKEIGDTPLRQFGCKEATDNEVELIRHPSIMGAIIRAMRRRAG